MNQAAKVITLPAFSSKKDVVEDVVFKDIPQVVKKKVVVVYNHFNIEAILAAAILKQCYDYFNIITVAQNIPNNGELYVWIGVNPDQVNFDVLNGKKEHMAYSTHEKQIADEVGHRPNMIDQICHDFMVRKTDRITKISFLASRFFMSTQKDIDLKDLAYVYNEMKNAVASMHGVERETLNDEQVVQQYMKDVKYIQSQFRNSYKRMAVVEAGYSKDVIYTTFSDHNFVLALRLMKLAHANFVNHTNGLNGQLIFSNMKAPEIVGDIEKVIMLN